MIDSFLRGGLRQEAKSVVHALIFKLGVVMSCNVKSLLMARHIPIYIYVEQWDSSDYVLLSNFITYVGRWTRAVTVREAIDVSVQKIV